MDFTTNMTNYPYIRARDIKGGKIQIDDLIFIDEDVFNKIKKYIIKSGDIAITIVGASVGDVAYAQKEVDGFNLTENAVRLTEFNNIVNGKYLFYVLSQEQYHEYMQTVAGGAAQPKLGIYKVERIKVVLPVIEVQNRIVKYLSCIDNAIENNLRRIRLLEQMAEELYKEWFVRFRFPRYENTEFENGLPKGWNIAPLSAEFNTTSGGTPSRTNMNYYSGSIPWIKTGELQGTFILDTEEHITEEAVRKSSAKLIPAYSLLIAMYAGANVGNLGINSTQATCNQACCVITTKGRYPLYYLLYFLQTQKGFLQSISFGAAQQNISQDIIKKLKVLLPPIALCENFNKIVSPYLQQCELLMRENQILTNQRDLLLPRLMSGKLEVNA